ncbi:MAG: hypothetical protein R2734_03405 [Nocardioides sp.]
MARAQSAAGVAVVGPSGMMDGQVGAVREALDGAGHSEVAILAYSAKYASAFFGPFREAVDSALEGDRRTYQQDPANALEGVRALLDVAEGWTSWMVKPALGYGHARRVRGGRSSRCGVQRLRRVRHGRGSRGAGGSTAKRRHRGVGTSIRRAGADVVLTYWAAEAAGSSP